MPEKEKRTIYIEENETYTSLKNKIYKMIAQNIKNELFNSDLIDKMIPKLVKMDKSTIKFNR